MEVGKSSVLSGFLNTQQNIKERVPLSIRSSWDKMLSHTVLILLCFLLPSTMLALCNEDKTPLRNDY